MKAIILLCAALVAVTAVASNEKKVVCYYGSWASGRQGDGKFDVENIDPKLCTHLIYTFVGINSNTGEVVVKNPWNDLADGGGRAAFARFNQLRSQNPGLKTMVAIGGWNEESAPYSRVAANPQLRAKFVDSVVDFVKKHGFDGFDVDWEYPAQRGGSPADKHNYVLLLKELKERFDREGGLLLSAAVAAAESSASQSYDIPAVTRYLDFVNLMTYDLHGSWEGKTGMNAPLYGNDKLTVDAAVKYWLSQGAPAEKLVLGVPFYGRSFTLSDPRSNGIGAPASAGERGPYTGESGNLGYNEICEKLKNENWQVEYDEALRGPYAFGGSQWVSYDDKRSLKEKTDYIKKLGLGGAMVWSIETDDFLGKCGEKFPLLNTLHSELSNGASSSPSLTNQEPQEPSYEPLQQYAPQTQQQYEPEPEYPPQQNQPSESICQAEGYTRDPNNCGSFYYCQPSFDGYISHLYQCSEPLVYNSAINTCDWPANVQC